jgi:hypothetical protein
MINTTWNLHTNGRSQSLNMTLWISGLTILARIWILYLQKSYIPLHLVCLYIWRRVIHHVFMDDFLACHLIPRYWQWLMTWCFDITCSYSSIFKFTPFFFCFHHQFKLVRRSVLASSGFSPLLIAVLGDQTVILPTKFHFCCLIWILHKLLAHFL